MEPPNRIDTKPQPLSNEQRGWINGATHQIDNDWMQEVLVKLVETPSPWGEERAIASLLTETMSGLGLDAEMQEIDDRSANAIGHWHGGDGPSLMIFAPLDSPFTGRAEDEVPWVGDSLPDHMKAQAISSKDGVIGLSADNPKAHIASALQAIHAVMKSGVQPVGSVTLAFAAGGAPAGPRPDETRPQTGHGRGCEFMMERGLRPDFAIVAKPGYAVAWEEVGLTWFRIRVRGIQTYVGRKHFLAYRNPIVEAAPVITALEAWCDDYAKRHSDGLVAPQGAVGAIQGGWPYKPSMVPAACDIYLDLRISPRTTPDQAKKEVIGAITEIKAANPGLEADCEMILAIPGFSTDPENWIIQSCIRGWEDTEAVRHAPFLDTSGQTEAVILRRHGIPTARMGLPAVMTASQNRPRHTMGMAEFAGMQRFTRCLIYSIVDTCTRSRKEVGL